MARYTHSILVSDQLVSADGALVYDLPVQPLSVLLLKIAPLNNSVASSAYQFLEGLLSAIDNIRVTFRGSDVYNSNGVDAVALALLFHKVGIWQANARETDNDRRALVVPIIFGRKAFMQKECFPATKKGELLLSVTWDIADTGFDGLRVSIETIELPGATPDFVQRTTSLSRTLTVTGFNEIDLPIGETYRGVLLFGTTGFVGAAPLPTLGSIQFLVNNQQQYISESDFEVLRSVMGLTGVGFPPGADHLHPFLDGAGPAVEANTRSSAPGASIDDNYALINLDPNMDDEYALATEGVGRVHVRLNADTADTVRALPIERVPAGRFLEGP